jgi:hypothetical protein
MNMYGRGEVMYYYCWTNAMDTVVKFNLRLLYLKQKEAGTHWIEGGGLMGPKSRSRCSGKKKVNDRDRILVV